MYDVIRDVYLGLYISIRPLNIDGPSNVLNWERHSDAAVDVRALSLFCKNNIDISDGELNNKEYKHLTEGSNACTTTWRFLFTLPSLYIAAISWWLLVFIPAICQSILFTIMNTFPAISLKHSNSWFWPIVGCCRYMDPAISNSNHLFSYLLLATCISSLQHLVYYFPLLLRIRDTGVELKFYLIIYYYTNKYSVDWI